VSRPAKSISLSSWNSRRTSGASEDQLGGHDCPTPLATQKKAWKLAKGIKNRGVKRHVHTPNLELADGIWAITP
jgi:hypothetical protein